MTPERIHKIISCHLHANGATPFDASISQSSQSRFCWLVESMVRPIFQQRAECLMQNGLAATTVSTMGPTPYAALVIETSFFIACLWPGETDRWLNLSLCKDRNGKAAEVQAISYRSIALGRLVQELDIALLEILPSHISEKLY